MRIKSLKDLLPSKGNLQGRWSLGPGDEIRYRAEGKEESFSLVGTPIAAEPGVLVAAVTQKQSDQKTVTQLLRLSGDWRLDSKNRIVFEIEKEDGKKDELVFSGGWQLNDSNEIVYSRRTRGRKRGRSVDQQIVFKGFWEFSGKHGLSYLVGGDLSQAFRVRGAFQSKSILAKKGELRYQLGAEVQKGARSKVLTLFGKWRISRDLGLAFEIEYSGGKRKSLLFGGQYAPARGTSIEVELRSIDGVPIGVELILTREIFAGNGEAFLRVKRSSDESAAEAGARFRW